MWPNVSLNDQLEIVFEGRLLEQRIRTTFHYELITFTGGPLAVNNAVSAFVTDAQWIALRDAFLACCPDNYALERTSVQFLKDPNVRYMKIFFDHVAAVGAQDAALSPNQQVSITRRGIVARRQFVGGIRIPVGQGAGSQADGFITPGLKAALDTLAALMDDNIVATFGGGDSETWQPVMFRIDASGDFSTSPIAQTRVMDTIRTIRRRTVGQGE